MKTQIRKLLEKIFGAQMRRIIAKHQPIIIGVTGSVGKTTTKLAIATVLEKHYRVQAQSGNYNAPISVPFIFIGRALPTQHNPFGWMAAWWHGQRVLKGPKPYDLVVVELGTDAPGDIAHFKSLLQVDIAVITAVSEEHMEYFQTVDTVAAEELAVANFAKRLVVNADDIAEQYLEAYVPKNTEVHSYGFEHAEYKLSTRQLPHGLRVSVELSDSESVQVTLPLLASHSAKAVAAAVAVADLLEVPLQAIRDGAEQITPPPGRMRPLRGIHGSHIIDDTYNASPLAVEAALKTLYDRSERHKIAILGQMNELGDTAVEAHERIGKQCDPEKLLALVTIGKLANGPLADMAEKRGCRVIRCASPYEAGARVRELIKKDTLILAKGSQNGVFAEEALKPLLVDQRDEAKLVRQSPEWLARKRRQFLDWAT